MTLSPALLFRPRVRARVLRVAPALLVLASFSGVSGVSEAGVPEALETITKPELLEHVKILASDELEGREAGKAGGRKAGEIIAAELKRLGLRPAGEAGTWFQNFQKDGRRMRNVLAALPGTDLADDVIVVGAHYDHLGHGDYGSLDPLRSKRIHNGADDNASGVAAVLEMAEAFVTARLQPRRTILFVLFDGEELGLLGSKHYVSSPMLPLASTVAMVNLDMIGRLGKRKLSVYGAKTGSTLTGHLEAANEALGLPLDLRRGMIPNSDHAPFYEARVPSIALFSGLHLDYHQPGDDIEKLDTENMTRIARLATALVANLCGADDRPTWAKVPDAGPLEMLDQLREVFGERDFSALPLLRRLQERLQKGLRGLGSRRKADKPRLGVTVVPADAGLRVRSVSRGSVAARAGLQREDIITRFGGQETARFETLASAVRSARGEVSITILRDGRKLTLTARFGPGSSTREPKARLY